MTPPPLRVLTVLGTRPEAIKLAPLVRCLAAEPDAFAPLVCVTAQHRDLLDPVLAFFGLTPGWDLDLMRPDQALHDLAARGLVGLRDVMEAARPDVVCVQGDTTTTFVGALAAAWAHVPVAHVEAGLRSGDREAPFPEEHNRVLTSHLARWHFAPTARARDALAREGVTDGVHVVGNTVIDALLTARALLAAGGDAVARRFAFLAPERRVVLVTAHRRESFGAPLEQLLLGLRDVADRHPEVDLVYPVHPNPHVREPAHRLLAGRANVHLLEPVGYPELVWLLDRCHVVVTDSGGLQEEAPTFGKPVLVTREVTERPEGVEAGVARLVGTDRARVAAELSRLLEDAEAWRAMARAVNPYGDGHASERIRDVLRDAPRARDPRGAAAG